MTRRPTWPAIAGGLVLVFVAMQFVKRPDFDAHSAAASKPISAHVTVPPDIDAVLRRSCYDCHSNETHWPWYARIAPASWLTARDVRHGRADLDFSNWNTDPDIEPTPDQRLGGICSDLERGIMPLNSYLIMHPGARVSHAERDTICAWTRAARAQLRRRRSIRESRRRPTALRCSEFGVRSSE